MRPTGDIGRIDENGNIFYVGRKDNQVKILGKRVQLEEVQSFIETIEGISYCRYDFGSQSD